MTAIWKYTSLFFAVFLIRINAQAQFTSYPPNINYGNLGESITLTWDYGTNVINLRKWSHLFPNGTERLILSVHNIQNATHPVYVNNSIPEYENRVSYSAEKAGLTINNLKVTDEGSIKCQVNLVGGEILESSVELKTKAPQILSLLPDKSELSENDKFIATCTVNSRPVSTLKWYKGNMEILTNNTVYNITEEVVEGDISLRKSVLFIDQVTRERADTYKCVATYQLNNVESTEALSTLIVYYKPENTEFQISPDSTLEDNVVILQCSAQGYPAPKYLIYNSTTLLQNEFGQFVLKNVKNHQEGVYKCVASNSVGNGTMLTKNLTIYVKPSILSSTTTLVRVAEGTAVNMTVQVHADPAPSSTWSSPVSVVGFSEDFSVLSIDKGLVLQRHSFTKSSASRSDSGVYNFKASNLYDEASQEFKLIVEYPPIISASPPTETHIEENTENVDLVCVVSGNPSPAVIWSYNDVPIATSDVRFLISNTTTSDSITGNSTVTSTLRIKKVVKEDLGFYKCEGVNKVMGKEEKRSEQTHLIISHDPVFLNNPAPEVIIKNNSNVILNCTVKAQPTPTVWWESTSSISSAKVQNETSNVIQTGNSIVSAVLKLRDVVTEDYGTFKCVAIGANKVVEAISNLKIEYIPQITASSPTVYTVEESTVKNISCDVQSFPKATVKWFYAQYGVTFVDISNRATEQNISTADQTFNFKTRSMLSFNSGSIKREDQGTYYCEATNAEGSDKEQTKLFVHWEPDFKVFEGPTNPVSLGSSINLKCIVTSNAKPTVKWYKDSTEVMPVQRIGLEKSDQITTATLNEIQSEVKISDAQPEDAGVYYCRATNNVLGETRTTERSIVVNVLYPPILTAISTQQNVSIGSTLTLSCSAHAYPPINEYRWWKDGNQIANNASTFQIPYIEKSSEGEYSCMPINSIGVGANVTHKVLVNILPEFTKTPVCKQLVQTMLHCECDGKGFPTPIIYWTKKSDGSTVSTEKTLNITIGQNSAGTYECNLRNSNGHVSLPVEVVDYVPSVTEWSVWTNCNNTCGNGFRSRTRTCNFQPCTESLLKELIDCVGNTCPINEKIISNWHEDWYIALWVAVPLLAALLLICCLWCCRSKRASKKPVLVPINRDISRVPASTLSRSDNIYLPQAVPMSGINAGYLPDDAKPPKSYENLEAELQFQEEIGVPVDVTNGITIIPEVEEEDEEREEGIPTHKVDVTPRSEPSLPKQKNSVDESPYGSLYGSMKRRSKKIQRDDSFSYRQLNGYI